jgi:hypothetical protein
MELLVHEVSKERVENAATTIRNNRGTYVKKNFVGAFIIASK